MKVYVVEFGYDYEGGRTEGVFKDKDKALALAKKKYEKEKLNWEEDKENYPNMQRFKEPNLKGNNYYKEKSFMWGVNSNYFLVKEFDVQ